MSDPTLSDVVSALDALFPPHLAESWDNVGLLVPSAGGAHGPCRRVVCTIDLTEEVLDEALRAHVDLVVAYHPPLFAPLRRFDPSRAADRLLLRAIRAGIAVFAPHTCVDAAPEGVNDWLAEGLGEGTRRPILEARPAADGVALPGAGQGRLVALSVPSSLDELVARIKAHLQLDHLRVAEASAHRSGQPIETVALCAGAGGKLFESVGEVDLLWTGEMRHHDVLARVAAGTSVVLCDHTHTERGYLARLGARLAGAVPGLEVSVSTADREPLAIR